MAVKKKNVKFRVQKDSGAGASVAAEANSFFSFLKPLIPRIPTPGKGKGKPPVVLQGEPLAHLVYAEELKVKDEGFRRFWEQHRLQGQPESVLASPRPRGYRTTSKRKALLYGPTLYLFMADKDARGRRRKRAFTPSPLEPPEHERIYRFLQQKLSEPTYRLVASHLNYLIIRGGYDEQVMIFNVNLMNGPLVRKLKMLAAHLQKLAEPVSAAFIYFDPSRSDYYLESRRPADALHFKKLFGPDLLSVNHEDCRFRFHPTSFSQINESMVPQMLALAREMLAPGADEYLLDLYCGYGLFSHFLAPDFKQVLGIDAEGPSIRSAAANSRFNSRRGGRTKFLGKRIDGKFLEELLEASAPPESVLLDPPRQGPQAGVIATLCQNRPRNILHVFCGVDQIPASLKEWRAGGYQVRRVVPLDMFPGTANLEVMILLSSKNKKR